MTEKSASGKPSSEINLDDIFKLAKDVDAAVAAEPAELPTKRKRQPKPNGQAEVIPFPAPEQIPRDPEFEAMVLWGVTSISDMAREKLDWSDPGVHWRDKMSVAIARLIQRIRPMQPGPVSDLITIAGYTALWAIPNVTAKRATTNKDSIRDNGERKDVQAS